MRTGEVQANLIALNEEFRLVYLQELIDRKTSGAEHSVLERHEPEFHQREYLGWPRSWNRRHKSRTFRRNPAAAMPFTICWCGSASAVPANEAAYAASEDSGAFMRMSRWR